jgi:hypothetical protein
VLVAQVAGAVFAPLALLFMPPVRGAMLLIPVGGANAIRFARDHDAAILGRGPIAGSVVAVGERASLALDPLGSGIVAIAAAPAGCGALTVVAP